MSMFFTEEKPWAKLRMSRKRYESLHIWKKCGKTRDEFGAFVLALPDELIEQILEHSEAERLVEAIFGKGCLDEKTCIFQQK